MVIRLVSHITAVIIKSSALNMCASVFGVVWNTILDENRLGVCDVCVSVCVCVCVCVFVCV